MARERLLLKLVVAYGRGEDGAHGEGDEDEDEESTAIDDGGRTGK
jgi:hypothetical protein